MKRDIKDRKDLELLVNTFYSKVKADKSIGPFFTEVAHVNWQRHLPVMYDFWENVLFFSGSYEGNRMNIHQNLNSLSSLKARHFKRWNTLFTGTVDELFKGQKADIIKQRALNISRELLQTIGK